MSKEIFDEVDYNTYLIDQYWDRINSDPVELQEATSWDDLNNYPKLSSKDALAILDLIYTQNSYVLYKEPWYNLLFKRLKKDINNGFVSMIDIQPSLFQKTMRFITPMLKLFSKANLFTQVLNDTNKFYDTCLGGCYNGFYNKMFIVIQYIDKSQINLDMLKTILHEYCHFYARKKHKQYVQFFEGMVSKFYKALVESIIAVFKLDIDKKTIQKLHETIMKWNFYKLESFKAKKHNLAKCINELEDINDKFANLYINLLLSRYNYDTSSETFEISNEVIRRAYLAISDEVTSAHISRYDYSYQEYFCADEIIAIMSFYKPNYKPYLQMLESLV